MTKHYGRSLVILAGLFLLWGSLARADDVWLGDPPGTTSTYPPMEFTTPSKVYAEGYVLFAGKNITEPAWVEAEYLVVDWEDVPDSSMIYTNATPVTSSYYVQPMKREKIIKHFKTIQEVIEYLNDKHKDANYQPEVYQAIPVKMSVEVQESTNWHLQKDAQKTYKWKEK
jgi:hypothetical protein